MAPEALAEIEYGEARGALLFADSDAARGRALRTADRAGCRILALESIGRYVDSASRRADYTPR